LLGVLRGWLPGSSNPATSGNPDDILENDEEAHVVYRVVRPADTSSIIEAMAAAYFAGEPVTRAGGATLKDHKAFLEMFVPRMAKEGNSVAAFDTTTGCVLGAFLNEDFSNPAPSAFNGFLKSSDGEFRACMKMIEQLEDALVERFEIPEDIPAKEWLHLFMLGVVPDSQGKHISSKLIKLSVKLAKAQGFKMAFAEATGDSSKVLLEKHGGARCEHFIDYSVWEGPAANSIRKLPQEGAKGMGLMVIDLHRFHRV